METPIYTCQRRRITASIMNPDCIETYRMFFVDHVYSASADPESREGKLFKKYGARQRRWKILLWEQDPHIGEWKYPDIELSDGAAYCEVPDVPGFETMIPPTFGWVPDVKISIAKGCYAIVNQPGDNSVINPLPFYIPFGQRHDKVYPGTSQEAVVDTTYFQQCTYNPGTAEYPIITEAVYLYFKVTTEHPGGFWVMSRILDPDAGYSGPTGAPPQPDWPTGPDWFTGPTGPPGSTGPTGPTGPRGASGPMGATGASGASGHPGGTGAPGGTGLPGGPGWPGGPGGAGGVSGPSGPSGPSGASGPRGPNGPPGAGYSGPNVPGMIYASETPDFPPRFTIGMAPFPIIQLNANWVASAYAPPRELSYQGSTVGETLTPIPQPITPKTTQEKAFAYENVDGDLHTIEWPEPHGFGEVGKKIKIRVDRTDGTLPSGLSDKQVYEFEIISAEIILYSGISSAGSYDFTGNLVKLTGDSVLAVMRSPARDTPIAAEGKEWVLSQLWQFFPKHYEMHHKPYANYQGEGTASETTSRSSSSNSLSDTGHIGIRCCRNDPKNPTPEHHTHDDGKCNSNSQMSMASSYSNHITPDLTESSRLDRVDWLQHNGELGGSISGSYGASSFSQCTKNGDVESGSSSTRTGGGLGPPSLASYMRIQPFTYDHDRVGLEDSEFQTGSDGPGPYNEIGTFGEFSCSASATMPITGQDVTKWRQDHVHPEICPAEDYDIYTYTYTTASVGLGAGEMDAWETCKTALDKVMAKATGGAAPGAAPFFGRPLEFEGFLKKQLLGDEKNPCRDGGETSCCNWAFNGGPTTFDIGKATCAGVVSATHWKVIATRVKMTPPVDNAHQVAPLQTKTVSYREKMGFGSSHFIKGFNYLVPIQPHDILLHCPISIANKSISRSSYAYFSNMYKSLEAGTAKIVTESKYMSSGYSASWSKNIEDPGLILRSESQGTSVVWDKVTTTITFDPLTGLVSGSTTVPEHTEESYPTYQDASVSPTQGRMNGNLLSKWGESSGDSRNYYSNEHHTAIL